MTPAACSWERRSTRVSMSNDSAHSPPAGRPALVGRAYRTNAIWFFTAQEAAATFLLHVVTPFGVGLVAEFTVRAFFIREIHHGVAGSFLARRGVASLFRLIEGR